MKGLYKLEKKFGRYAIRNLSLYIAICFILSYILSLLVPTVYQYMTFSPYDIYYGHQYWRFFTWILTNPGSFDIFSLIMIFFYFSIGMSIERGIGTFMYNLYVFGTLFLITVAQAVVWTFLYFTHGLAEFQMDCIATMGGIPVEAAGGASMMTYYLTTSIFLGYALLYEDNMVLLFFVIPFKVKWMAYIDGLYLLYYFVKINGIASRITIIGIAVSFFALYYIVRKSRGRRSATFAQRQKQRNFKDATKMKRREGNVVEFPSDKAKPSTITRHKCAICGKTERDGDDLEFRFCSKCNGNYEYCKEHLYTHEHIK